MRGPGQALRPLVGEALGTAMLLAAIVGSGIVVSGAGDSASIALFQHAVVVGVTLVALILVLGPVSGAHLNPAVTLALALSGHVPWRTVGPYVAAQLLGGTLGTVLTHVTFGLPAVTIATTARTGLGMAGSELVATAGLLLVILGLLRVGRPTAIPAAVGAWIAAAIVFTASDAFANPAVTLSRVLTDTWTGITPTSVPGFLGGQGLAVLVAVGLAALLYPTRDDLSSRHPIEEIDR